MRRITVKNPFRKWLFGGLGFHNSEATMTPIMTEKFLNERALKCFREISPTFSRVYGGYADWTKEAMDRFADYYDKTFRKSGTLIYMVPGRMPMPRSDFDLEEYCERTARNLDYLINTRGCKKIQYFCVTNELSVGNTYAYLASRLDDFAKYHDALYRAFVRHGLDVGLLATDCSGERYFDQIKWAVENIDEITSDYCTHLYLKRYQPGELEAYEYCRGLFEDLALQAKMKQKRFIVGEYGIVDKDKILTDGTNPMGNDISYAVTHPENDGIYAIAIAEMALSIVNSGTFSGVFWTLFDYPDPFIKEEGDSECERGRYEVARFSGHGLAFRYNKHGLIRWCDEEGDYSSRAALYTMGYMAKLFKKGSRVLECELDDELLRAGAVVNPDGSVSICIISWADTPKEITLSVEKKPTKPLRRYDFCADAIPYNEFCDLQPCSGSVACSDGEANITVPPRSVTFLTTDYKDRAPSEIEDVRIEGDTLLWSACTDEEHCYYRVYCDGKQIASTVAEYCKIANEDLHYHVVSVDKYGNEGK